MDGYKTGVLMQITFIVDKRNTNVSKIHLDCRKIILIKNKLTMESKNARVYLSTLPFFQN